MPVVVAEKLEAIFQLGMLSSRMKDFFDIWFLANTFPFESNVLAQAMRATFRRRGTELNAEKFKSLVVELNSDSKKHEQWSAFMNKSGVASAPEFSAAVRITTVLCDGQSSRPKTKPQQESDGKSAGDGEKRHFLTNFVADLEGMGLEPKS